MNKTCFVIGDKNLRIELKEKKKIWLFFIRLMDYFVLVSQVGPDRFNAPFITRCPNTRNAFLPMYVCLIV